MITQERKDELTKAGWYIEDMGEEWGPDFADQYRFMHKHDEDTFGDIQYSMEDAWDDCCQYQLSLVSIGEMKYI